METDVDALLGTRRRASWRHLGWWIAAVLLLAVAAGAGWWWQQRRQGGEAPRYATQPVLRGDLNLRVTANGTLQPTRTVNIGSELSGTVSSVRVDVNDRVRRGQLLVELDTSKLRDQVARSRAGLASAQARVAQAQAASGEARRKLERQRGIERLSQGVYPAPAELDAAQSAHDRALADEAVANAAVADARAAASLDETNLAKASIRAPIDGVVLARNVDPGNAVAASLQAVTLLVLAEDLKQMKLQVSVDEADVGQVREGQRATFTVSAWPQRSWPAVIRRIGYGSSTKDNVVTYQAELDVDNADLSLRPGMTAVATIAATERRGVLLVPSAALRFTPSAAAAPPGPSASASVLSRLMPRPPSTGATRRAGTTATGPRRVWVLREGLPVEVAVTPGLSDGRRTEIVDGDLHEGDAVIVEQAGRAP